jgi:allophanate hydrolase
MLLPTAPTIYKVAEMQADALRLNARLGTYTNFVNLLDCAAVAIPAGFRGDGLPFGVTLIAPAFHDSALAALADRLHRYRGFGIGKDRTAQLPEASRMSAERPAPGRIPLFVVGAHLTGMPLNGELTAHGAVLLRRSRTAAGYRLYALAGTTPPKPGLLRSPGFAGPGIEGELWSIDAAEFGKFAAAVPSPLGIGKVVLEDGSEASGFLCESFALSGAEDITSYGGWRAYRATTGPQSRPA